MDYPQLNGHFKYKIQCRLRKRKTVAAIAGSAHSWELNSTISLAWLSYRRGEFAPQEITGHLK